MNYKKDRKILIGITYYYPNISGVSIYAQRLAEALVKRGWKVSVITSRHDDSLKRVEYLNGVKVVRVPAPIKLGKGIIMPTLPFYILKEIKGVDYLNLHLPQFESFIFAIIGKLLGKKVVLTHHTDLSGWKGLKNRLAEVTAWSGQLVAALLADKILPYTKDYARSSWFLRLFKSKLDYLYPPIFVKEVDSGLKKQLKAKIGSTKSVIGFSGRVARQKGIPYLINTIPILQNSLKDFKIVFAGPYKEVIGESYYMEIEPLINKYKKYLVFLGSLNQKQLSAFYDLCDVLVLPSDDTLESFGIVQVEAMLNGCPVVASDLPGVRVPIKKTGMGEIASVGNVDQLAVKILKIISNKADYIINKNKIKQIFDFEKTVDYYEQL